MSRFNTSSTTVPTKVTNLHGGVAYEQTPEMELVSLLLTSMATDQFYEKTSDKFTRLKNLIAICDKKFVAQALVYARTTMGMRSVTHVGASMLAKHISGTSWGKDFFKAVVYRPDDMMEIVSFHISEKQKVSNAMKDGFRKAFDKFDEYQLSNYKASDKDVKLVDIVNSVRPIPTEKNAKALKDLVNNVLKAKGKFNSALSKAGQTAKTETEKLELKKNVWVEQIRTKKIGYMALLRNLSNIVKDAPEVLTEALESLVHPGFIKSSLTFPFQYLVAYKQFRALNTKEGRLVTEALSKAIEISCENVKSLNFSGNTLVAIDNSGSMDSSVATSRHMKMSELGAVFGMVLAKGVNADIMEFGSKARYIPYRLKDDVMEFGAKFSDLNAVGHGTEFSEIFYTANKKYDRIVIFSDMQSSEPSAAVTTYRKQYGADPYIYLIDLAGNGTQQFPNRSKYFQLSGFSEKIFNTMANLETDKNALINEIKKIVF